MSNLALLCDTSTAATDLSPHWPQSDDLERHALREVLDSHSWYNGDRVREFEASFAEMQNAKYGIACTGGTVALEMIVRGAGIGPNDEIITSPYTFIGTCSAILKAGAAIRFVDVDPETNNLDIDQIEEAITPHTRAVMPVHFGGLACDIDRLVEICERRDLVLLEDSCHGWGAKYKDKGLGAWGLAGGFSFQQSKNMTCGDGGIALTDDEAVADAIGCAINQGRSRYGKADPRLQWGGNHRMTEFSAAILLAQMSRLPEHVEIREQNAGMLTRLLTNISGLEPCKRDPGATVVSWHVYGGRYFEDEWDGLPREIFVKAMAAEGVSLTTGYPEPVYKDTVFQQDWANSEVIRPFAWAAEDWVQDYRSLNLPKVEQYCIERISLKHTSLLVSESEMKATCDVFEKMWEYRGELVDAWRSGKISAK
ncbi:MAG: aminotransferase DegT [Gemmatimonadetes bacterium]|nr:aminotransferase DegT [Gemmatimonadota bacterium]